MGDSNAAAQDKALDALVSYLSKASEQQASKCVGWQRLHALIACQPHEGRLMQQLAHLSDGGMELQAWDCRPWQAGFGLMLHGGMIIYNLA